MQRPPMPFTSKDLHFQKRPVRGQHGCPSSSLLCPQQHPFPAGQTSCQPIVLQKKLNFYQFPCCRASQTLTACCLWTNSLFTSCGKCTSQHPCPIPSVLLAGRCALGHPCPSCSSTLTLFPPMLQLGDAGIGNQRVPHTPSYFLAVHSAPGGLSLGASQCQCLAPAPAVTHQEKTAPRWLLLSWVYFCKCSLLA